MHAVARCNARIEHRTVGDTRDAHRGIDQRAIDSAVAIVIDPIADFDPGLPSRKVLRGVAHRANVLAMVARNAVIVARADGAREDALAASALVAGRALDHAFSTIQRVGLKVESVVDDTVAVVVFAVTYLCSRAFPARADETLARPRAQGLSRFAFAHAVIVRAQVLARLVGARVAIVDDAVAIVVDSVADLSHRGIRGAFVRASGHWIAGRILVPILAGEFALAVHAADRCLRNIGAGSIAVPAMLHVAGQVKTIIGLSVAVIVQTVAGLHTTVRDLALATIVRRLVEVDKSLRTNESARAVRAGGSGPVGLRTSVTATATMARTGHCIGVAGNVIAPNIIG